MIQARRERPLAGRTLYVPRMSEAGARGLVAAFRSVGIDAELTPPSDERTIELGNRYTAGEECYPAIVTTGDFLRILETEDPSRVAFLMPTTDGPCRFGEYAPYMRKILKDLGLDDVPILSPTSGDGYQGLGDDAGNLVRTAWRGVVAGDILLRLLLRTRPYERNPGETDHVFGEAMESVAKVIERRSISHKERLAGMVEELERTRDRFRAIPRDPDGDLLLIGVVGEIFCRLNDFSNLDAVRTIERLGGEVWISDVSEWLWYVNERRKMNLRERGRRISSEMLRTRVKQAFQRADEHALLRPFRDDFRIRQEPHSVRELLDNARVYLPPEGAFGEMILSLGRTIYLEEKGVDGVIDLSPFTCMNAIVCEAIYPRLSREHGGIPIRTLYFDGTQSDLERDIGIFMELARTYRRRKQPSR